MSCFHISKYSKTRPISDGLRENNVNYYSSLNRYLKRIAEICRIERNWFFMQLGIPIRQKLYQAVRGLAFFPALPLCRLGSLPATGGKIFCPYHDKTTSR